MDMPKNDGGVIERSWNNVRNNPGHAVVGAIVGQILFPVPFVGAAAGAAVGGWVGKLRRKL